MWKPLDKLNTSLSGILRTVLVSVFLFLVLVVLWGVATRYLLGSQAPWSEELARLLMVWLALLGAALADREASHLGMDAIFRTWPPGLKRIAAIMVALLVIAFSLVILVYGGSQWIAQRFAAGQVLPALGIAKAWFYVPLPLCGGLIALFETERLFSLLAEKEGHVLEGDEVSE